MPERFGLKDVVVLSAVALLGVIVLLKMWQDDRVWDKLEALQTELQTQREMIASLANTPPPPPFNPVSQSTETADPRQDTSWSVSGVELTWLTPPAHPNDPRALPGFRDGGTLTEAIEGNPARFTPYLYDTSYGQRIVDLVCEPLVVRDFETLQDRAALAVAYQSDPDGMWCRVHLDPGARFSDGSPVTSEDVRWTFHEFVMHPALGAERWRDALGVIERVDVIDERTCEFRFIAPDFRNLEAALRMLSVLPKHVYAPLTIKEVTDSSGLLVGSGPFRLSTTGWSPGEPVVLVRNEFYNRPDAPIVDQLRFVTITDKGARLEAIRNSEVDIARPTASQLDSWSRDPALARDHKLIAWENARSGFTFMTWNCESELFNDARVRLAMTMLLDRERIVRDLYNGLGSACTGPFSTRTGQGDPAIEPMHYDIDGARSLLAQSGWTDHDGDGSIENKNGEPFVFTYMHAAGSISGPRLGAYLQDQCAAVGIECRVEAVEFGAFLDAVRTGSYDAASFKWRRSSLETDPHQLWHSTSPDNMSRWRSPLADELIDRGRSTADPIARRAVWHELHRLIHDKQPVTFLVNTNDLRIVHERIANVHAYAGGLDISEMFEGAR